MENKEFYLTPKGLDRLEYVSKRMPRDFFVLPESKQGAYKLGREYRVLYNTNEGALPSFICSGYAKTSLGTIRRLIEQGYIKEGSRTPTILLEDIRSQIGRIKGPSRSKELLVKHLETYLRVAYQKPVSETRIEEATEFFAQNISGSGMVANEKKVRSMQKEARSRSDKIVALDSAVSYFHDGFLTEHSDVSRRDMHAAGSIDYRVNELLDKLREE